MGDGGHDGVSLSRVFVLACASPGLAWHLRCTKDGANTAYAQQTPQGRCYAASARGVHLCYAFASQGITSGTNETVAQSRSFAFGANFAHPLPSRTADHRNILSVAVFSGKVSARTRGSCLTTLSGRTLPYGKRLRSILAPAFNRPILAIPPRQRPCFKPRRQLNGKALRFRQCDSRYLGTWFPSRMPYIC